MGLFNKKKDKREEIPKLPELPTLPELPEVPEFEKFTDEKLPQLPSFPNGNLGNKFSQNTIKEAVTGKKEEEVRAEDEEEIPMMRKSLVKEEGEDYPEKDLSEKNYSEKIIPRERPTSEPIFIRMDKFEDGSRSFEEVKNKVADIEKMLRGIKQIKEEEERELQTWADEIVEIKEKLQKVDEDIFAKVR